MSTVRKGSDIIKEIHNRENLGYGIGSNIHTYLLNTLDKVVVVPEDTWTKIEKMLYFENVLEGDVLIPQAKWEKIQKVIEKFPMPDKYGLLWRDDTHTFKLDTLDEIKRWFEELREAVEQ